MLEPSRGSITINGMDTMEEWKEVKQMLGYCPQQSILYDTLTVVEHLHLYSILKGSKDGEVEQLLAAMRMEDKAEVQCCTLSEGLRRRLSVALAFAGGSSVVVLDEPTSGVDPAARRYIWDLVLQHKEDRTILVSTHYMDEAEILCDKIAILHRGSLRKEGTCESLQLEYGNQLQLHVFTGGDPRTEVSSVTSSTVSTSFPSDSIDDQVHRLIPGAAKTGQSHRKRTYNLPA